MMHIELGDTATCIREYAWNDLGTSDISSLVTILTLFRNLLAEIGGFAILNTRIFTLPGYLTVPSGCLPGQLGALKIEQSSRGKKI